MIEVGGYMWWRGFRWGRNDRSWRITYGRGVLRVLDGARMIGVGKLLMQVTIF